MIDLHTHILPAVDDGAPDLETALAMGRSGVEQGLAALAVTPHFYGDLSWSKIKEKIAELQREFQEARLSLELIAGAEIFMDAALLEMTTDQIPTYGNQGKFCLIELPLHQIPIYTDQVLFKLQAQGITPILAHPERYGAVLDDPNIVLNWLDGGCLVQLNAGSILGRFGAKIQETSQIMLTHNMVQLVASDAHGSKRRRLNLPTVYPVLTQILGGDGATDLVKNNPRAILRGDFQPKEAPRKYEKKRRFFFF